MLTLRQIEVFRAVMRSGSAAGASRLLAISQPTVTRIIRRMEDQLGVTLFARAGGRLHASRFAEKFLADIDVSFSGLTDVVARAVAAARDAGDFLRIGASPSLGRLLLPMAFRALASARPNLALHLDVLTVNQVRPFLLDGGGDAAATLFRLDEPDILSVQLGDARPVHVSPISGANDWIGFERNSVHGAMMLALLSGEGEPIGVRRRARLAETAIGLAEAGVGQTIVDEFSARSADVRRVRLAIWPTDRSYPVFLHRRVDSPRAADVERLQRILADFVRDLAHQPMS